MPTREVFVEDAFAWCAARPTLPGCSIVTAIPDVSELGAMPLARWEAWFVDAARLCLSRIGPDALCVFTQTDIRREGRWIDKGAMLQRAAADVDGVELLARKVLCRKPPGTISTARAAFMHLLVFGRGLRLDPARPDVVPDVIVEPGEPTWTRGLGARGAAACVQMITRYAGARTVVDPFCGEGMVLAVANAMGCDAIGVELNGKRADKARALHIDPASSSLRVGLSARSPRPRI